MYIAMVLRAVGCCELLLHGVSVLYCCAKAAATANLSFTR